LRYEISNSIYENIGEKNSIPAFSDSKYSSFNIINTTFRNIDIISGLFGEESRYILDDITLFNIKTNSKALLYFIYNDIYINNLKANNIYCLGESGTTSFILFDSGEDKKELTIKNMNAYDFVLNGPFLKVEGDLSEVKLDYVNINDMKSYGSIIKINSRKSNTVISNMTFYNNVNNNKFDCGNIYFGNQFNISISNSKFSNNYSKSNGGVICIDTIYGMNANLTSNVFEYNKGVNGGSIYLNDIENNYKPTTNKKIIVNMEYNIFLGNEAEYFGGAIYALIESNNQLFFKNNEVMNNKAGVMGGGLFSPKLIKYEDNNDVDSDYNNKNNKKNKNNTISNFNSYFNFFNNTVLSVIDNYTSKPSYITLENIQTLDKIITSGKFLPLNFTLHDGYGNIMVDITKYYSSLTIKVTLKEVNNSNNNNNIIYSVSGNIGSFLFGICELNYFRIFARPNKYLLNFQVENYIDKIDIKFNDIEIEVMECERSQIKKYDKNGLLYCEDPICRSSCQTNISAICLPNEQNINDVDHNICFCMEGWEGIDCEKRIFTNLDKTKNTVYAINIPVYFIIIFYIIFVIINRKESIIVDSGFYKIFFFTLGIMFYFVSNLFSTFEDYKECSLHFMFKHFGLSIVFIMYSICICLASELSINNESKNKLKAVSFEIVTTELGMYSSSTKSNEKIKKEEEEKEQEKENEDYGLKSIKFVDDLIPDETVNTNEVNTHLELKLMRISSIMLNDENTKKNKKDKKELNSKLNGSIKANSHTDSSMKKNKNNDLLRNILRIRSLFIEITMLYLLYIIMTVIIIIIFYRKDKKNKENNNTDMFIQDYEKTWTYNCQLTNMDLIYNFLYLLKF
jgi:hypothetical protein